jgi:hypothetical protein
MSELPPRTQCDDSIPDGEPGALRILVTDLDKRGDDIAQMSNFFDTYIKDLTLSVRQEIGSDFVGDIPASDLAIMAETIDTGKAILNGAYSYVLDYDSLPSDVRKKLKSGEYTLGHSRQVEGNVRAVVVDGEGTRVKDITLKKVRNDPDVGGNVASIAEQIQLRQIYEKLDEVQALQRYQVDRDRDRDIITPFLDARDYVYRAQLSTDEQRRRDLLEHADAKLVQALNGTYTELKTASRHLDQETRWPVFRKEKLVQGYIQTLASDLQLATQFAGVQMHILDYIGDKSGSAAVLSRYQSELKAFCESPVPGGRRGLTAIELMQGNCDYGSGPKDFWYRFGNMVHDMPTYDPELVEVKEILFLSFEEPKQDQPPEDVEGNADADK